MKYIEIISFGIFIVSAIFILSVIINSQHGIQDYCAQYSLPYNSADEFGTYCYVEAFNPSNGTQEINKRYYTSQDIHDFRRGNK